MHRKKPLPGSLKSCIQRKSPMLLLLHIRRRVRGTRREAARSPTMSQGSEGGAGGGIYARFNQRRAVHAVSVCCVGAMYAASSAAAAPVQFSCISFL